VSKDKGYGDMIRAGRGAGSIPGMTKGNKRGEAKERSITEGRATPPRGKQVYTPGRLRSLNPSSVALEK